MKKRMRQALWGVLFLNFLFLAGCQTTKNLTTNIAGSLPGIAKDISADVKNTSQNIWQAVIKADNWIKENLW